MVAGGISEAEEAGAARSGEGEVRARSRRERRLRRGPVLLLTPPYHCGMVESAGVWMPYGLACLAGALRAHSIDAVIYDAMSRFDELPQIRQELRAQRPAVVATTAYTATVGAALATLRAAREEAPDAVTVIGGVHPTHMAAEVLMDPAVDFVVRGEGEEALPELVQCLQAGDDPAKVAGVSFIAGTALVETPARPLLADLDRRPVAWDAIDWPLYHYRTKPGSRLAITSWARGCTHACNFCSQQKLWRRTWRPRAVDAVVDEVRMLQQRFGVDTLEVADENPTSDGARWEAILDRLIDEDLGVEILAETRADDVVRDAGIIEKYHDAGILHMYVGVESVRQDRLDGIRKELSVEQGRESLRLLNGAGIITETSFLFGFPDETPESIEQTLALALTYDPDLAFFLAVTPWPYADWYPEIADRVEVRDYSQYNLINPILRPDAMTRDELAAELSRCFMAFYARKMRSLHRLPEHKRDYLRRVARLLMEESYLAGEAGAALPLEMTAKMGGAGRPVTASSQIA